ncbi:hypothetical protein CYMTET_11622 [Cymbomonas tetramitiformis]|uniref:Deacetylase sirtuin-type domain-containing protein n=1 Tax=Cymbomonas tetramitiformis TaxID=36881 RepID=A0AAE0GM25_9CHLO|nr:hypothetical protein CYMTET_11622 [Cymbomonas tetramitiformis]
MEGRDDFDAHRHEDAGDPTSEIPGSREYYRAASAILEADYLLVATGAGFSADSGLPVYKDIADVRAYKDKNLTYSDLCRASLLAADPRLFYGFWGHCYNLYQDTHPHEGYAILSKWFEKMQCRSTRLSTPVPSCGNRHYVYTSNIDGHHRRTGILDTCLLEIHGCLNDWVCTSCGSGPSPLPADFRFAVDDETRQQIVQAEGASAHEACATCGGQRRPSVMMFDDDCLDIIPGLPERMEAYQVWEASVEDALSGSGGARVVVLELGCGVNVPSVRQECEDVVKDCVRVCPEGLGSSALLIRVNPDFPLNPRLSTHTLSMRQGALAAIRGIECAMAQIEGSKCSV